MRRCVTLTSALLMTVLCTQGCWPGVPIAAAVLGGGSSGSKTPNTLVDGTIIVGGASTLGRGDWFEDQEPNDSILLSRDLGVWHGATREGVRGAAGTRLRWHAAHVEGGATRLIEDDLLAADFRRSRRRESGRSVRFLARDEDEVLVGLGADPLVVSRRASLFGRERGRLEVDLDGEVTGMTAAGDVLWLLVHSPSAGDRLKGIDLLDGTALFEQPLVGGRLRGLTGGEDLRTGRERLFAWSDADGSVAEIIFQQVGSDLVFGGMRPLELAGLPRAVGAMAYDGVFLHVAAAGRSSVQVYAPELSRALAVLPTDAPLTALAARTELDFDAFRVRIPAGKTVSVDLRTGGRGAAFVMSVDRDALLRGEGGVSSLARLRGGELWSGRLAAAERSLDVVIGSLGGALRYELRAGMGAAGPALAAPWRANDETRSLQSYLSAELETLDAARLVQRFAGARFPEHVPGQVVYGLKPGVTTASLSPEIGEYQLQQRPVSASGVGFLDWSRSGAGSAGRAILGVRTPGSMRRASELDCLRLMNRLERDPGIAWCEPAYLAHPLDKNPDDPLWPAQRWQHDAMNLPRAWDETTGATTVTIAVVDSGIRTENVDLAPNLVDGYDFVSSSANSGDGDGIDPDPYDERGPNSHGTHVAGTIAARGDNGVGVVGVMWNARIMPLRVIGANGTGIASDIAEAVRYAAGLSNSSGTVPDVAADVINLSLGTSSPSAAMESAIIAAGQRGVVVLAATGNSGMNQVLYPAAYAETIAIGASVTGDEIAVYSNYGPEVDLTAPGGDVEDRNNDGYPDMILSTIGSSYGDGSYAYLAGTSMACANASGVAGLLRSVNPDLDTDAMRLLMQQTALDLGASGGDPFFGAGLIDAEAAVDLAAPILALNTEEVDFGANGSDLVVQADNVNGGILVINGLYITQVVGLHANWLTATLLANGKTIALYVDRTGLAEGFYQALLHIKSNGGDKDVTVSLEVGSGGLTDVGPVIVQLLDSNGAVVKSAKTDVDKLYEYRLRGFPKGAYFLRCGVDLDADGVICEVGEPCGHYPNADAPTILDLSTLGSLSVDLLLE